MRKKFIRVSLMFRLVEMAECHEPLGQSAFHLSGRRTQFVGRAAGLVALHARNCAAVWGGPAQDPSLSKSWLAGDFRRELLELRMTVCGGDLGWLGIGKVAGVTAVAGPWRDSLHKDVLPYQLIELSM